MNGKYVGYIAGEDPLHSFLSKIVRDRLDVREPLLAFRVFRLSGSNEVYAHEEKFSGAKVICKFYGTRFGRDLDKAAGMARQEYDCLKLLRQYNLVASRTGGSSSTHLTVWQRRPGTQCTSATTCTVTSTERGKPA